VPVIDVAELQRAFSALPHEGAAARLADEGEIVL
jgi:hypothetical protein